jgi:hypothetical protein
MFAIPQGAVSFDLNSWYRVAEGLQLGMNPYARSQLLNWPPFWMEMIYVCLRVSERLGIQFFTCIRILLIAADLGVLTAVAFLLRSLDRRGAHGWLLLIGYCFNPLLVLLTVQHANFDAFAELWIVLFLICLIRFRRRSESMDYLLASACLGMAGFTKTFPLALWPLLAPGARRVSPRTRWLAAGLVAGPALFSLAPLYVLSSNTVRANVIAYRGFGESFGILGLLSVFHAAPPLAAYSRGFTYVFLIALVALAFWLWRHEPARESDVVLLATLILFSMLVVGPGYAPQHWFWIAPLLIVVYQQYQGLRIITAIAALIIVASNVFEYAIMPVLGQFLIGWRPSTEALLRYGQKVQFSDPDCALLRLPMTLASLLIFVAGIVVLTGGNRKNLLMR